MLRGFLRDPSPSATLRVRMTAGGVGDSNKSVSRFGWKGLKVVLSGFLRDPSPFDYAQGQDDGKDISAALVVV